MAYSCDYGVQRLVGWAEPLASPVLAPVTGAHNEKEGGRERNMKRPYAVSLNFRFFSCKSRY